MFIWGISLLLSIEHVAHSKNGRLFIRTLKISLKSYEILVTIANLKFNTGRANGVRGKGEWDTFWHTYIWIQIVYADVITKRYHIASRFNNLNWVSLGHSAPKSNKCWITVRPAYHAILDQRQWRSTRTFYTPLLFKIGTVKNHIFFTITSMYLSFWRIRMSR